MAHKFRNKLEYDLEVGHAYLITVNSTKPIIEAANMVMFYIGEVNGHPAFTPVLDVDPTEGQEAVLDHTLFNDPSADGVVAVIGRFMLVDCNPDNLRKSRNAVKPVMGETRH